MLGDTSVFGGSVSRPKAFSLCARVSARFVFFNRRCCNQVSPLSLRLQIMHCLSGNRQSMAGPPADDALLVCNMHGFRAVTFQYGKVHMTGGHVKTAAPMETKNVGAHIFVKMSSKHGWLRSAVAGSGRWTLALSKRVTLLDMLHTYVAQACDGELDGQVLPPLGGDEEEHDPMADLEVSDDESPSKRFKQHDGKRTRYSHTAYKRSILQVKLPESPPEVAAAGGGDREIRLYILDRKQLWLHIDDVPWAVKWMYIQVQLKGVPLVDDDSSGPSTPSHA